MIQKEGKSDLRLRGQSTYQRFKQCNSQGQSQDQRKYQREGQRQSQGQSLHQKQDQKQAQSRYQSIIRGRVIWHILIIGWMVLIFVLSAQGTLESSGLSDRLTRNIAQVLFRDFGNMQDAEQMLLVSGLQHIVRKCAHAFLYFVLGLLCMGTVCTYRAKLKTLILFAFMVVLIYAVSDEIHQLFVPGRSGEVADVLIDAAGGLAGIAALVGIRRVAGRFVSDFRN